MPTGSPGQRGYGFIPTQINGCVLWLRADQGIAQSGGVVSSWADYSPSGNNASQGTAGKQPALIAQDPAYNGQPTLQFVKASSQFMALRTVLPAQSFTTYIVGESTSGGSQQQFFGDSVNNVTGPYWTGVNWAMFAGGDVTASGQFANTQGPLAFSAVFNGASSALYINNSQVAAGGPGNASNSNPTGIEAIGGTGSGTINLNGKMAEFIVYQGAHTLTQRQFIFRYFAARYAPGAWS